MMTERGEILTLLSFHGAPHVNPRQRDAVVLSRAKMDISRDCYRNELVVLSLDSGALTVLDLAKTGETCAGTSPKWSPDGSCIAFFGSEGTNEIWIYDRESKTARRLTSGTNVKDYVWSPEGGRIAYVAHDREHDGITFPVSRLRYKLDGEGMKSGFDHVYVVDIVTAETRQVSSAPSDHHSPVFYADGERLAFVADFPDGNDLEKEPRIVTANLSDGTVRSLVPGVKSISALLLDGDIFYGVGKKAMENSVEFDKLFLWEEGRPVRWLSDDLDAPVGCHVLSDTKRLGLNPVFSAGEGGGEIFFTVTKEGRQKLFVFKRGSALIQEIPLASNVLAFALCGGDGESRRFVFLADSMRHPAELYTARWNRKAGTVAVERLTHWNDAAAASLPKAKIGSHAFRTPDGQEIHGWEMGQESHENGGTLGTVLVIHGGPHFCYGDSFFHDFWLLCGQGFRVVFCNPRGSSGYGQAFSDAIIGEWGRGDADDVMGFLGALRGKGKELGPLFLMGGSYGGYLVNWMISHYDCFRAAVAERSICNLYSKFGSSDLGFVINKKEMGDVDLWSDEELLMSRSPIRYAARVSAPLLILHGEADLRCPIEQSEQWYNALKRLGKEVEYIRFPGASHAMASAGRPLQRLARLKAISDWLARHSAGLS